MNPSNTYWDLIIGNKNGVGNITMPDNVAQKYGANNSVAPSIVTPNSMPLGPAVPTVVTPNTNKQPTQSNVVTSPENTNNLNQNSSRLDFSNPDVLANALKAALQPTPTQQYYKLRGQQMDDRLMGKGVYAIDPNAGFSPSQVEQVQNAGDKLYGSQLDTIAADAVRQAKPELTAGQASAFNNIVSQMNKSPLIAAADRIPVLKSSIDSARKAPSNAALQLNLVYSYIQALDTYQSAVREGELSLVNSIDSKIGQLSNYVSQVQNGQLVRPEVINQMADAASNIVETINNSAKNKARSFESQANAQGLGDVWKKYTSGFTPSYMNTNTGTTTNTPTTPTVSATGGFDF